MKKAFTLIELLVFIAIFSIVVVLLITIFVAVLNVQTSQTAASEVNQQSQLLLQQIQYYVQSARLVDMVQDSSSSTLVVRGFVPAQDPTSLMLVNGGVYLQQGVGGSLQPITSNKVLVSNLSFTSHYNLQASSSVFGIDSVSFSFVMTATSTQNKQYTQSFESSAAVLVPVPKIAMIQQTSTVANGPSVSSLVAAYPTNNETGSLLIAVVGNVTSSASVSLADTAGNAWTRIANTSYPAYNEKLTVFDAVNAKNTSNTVTATLGTGAGYASLFLYEYRGASTSSSFDASSSQLQANTQSPSSGSATATSAIELLFGVNYNGNTSEVPGAGNGFSLETSSTVTHVFVEDAKQYVTGPVAATWQYSGTTPSSSALIVTFK